MAGYPNRRGRRCTELIEPNLGIRIVGGSKKVSGGKLDVCPFQEAGSFPYERLDPEARMPQDFGCI